MKPLTAATIAVALICAVNLFAQDVITLGTASAAGGGTATIPVYVRDVSGTALGSDAGTGNRIQGIAIKVTYGAGLVSAASFARAGVTQSLVPLYETNVSTSTSIAWIASFAEVGNPIPFALNAAAPGNQVATLSITMTQAAAGQTVVLTIDPITTVLSNQAGTVLEKLGSGLTLENGNVNVTPPAGVPTGVVANATSTTSVTVNWNAVGGADQYQVYRASIFGGAEIIVGTTATTSLNDGNVEAGKTYLYRVRAIDNNTPSAFSAIDPATTVMFSDDPIQAGVTNVRAIHLQELYTAVNAMRTTAGLPTIAMPAGITSGGTILASHITTVRNALATARSTLGLSALSFTDTLTAGTTTIRAAHVQEIRTGVR